MSFSMPDSVAERPKPSQRPGLKAKPKNNCNMKRIRTIAVLIVLLAIITASMSSCKSNGFTSCHKAKRIMHQRHH